MVCFRFLFFLQNSTFFYLEKSPKFIKKLLKYEVSVNSLLYMFRQLIKNYFVLILLKKIIFIMSPRIIKKVISLLFYMLRQGLFIIKLL